MALASIAASLFTIYARTGQPYWVLLLAVFGALLIFFEHPHIGQRGIRIPGFWKLQKPFALGSTAWAVLGATLVFVTGGAGIAAKSVFLLGCVDGIAGLIGARHGTRALPHNPRKSWEGTVSGLFAGFVLSTFIWPHDLGIIYSMLLVLSLVESSCNAREDNFFCLLSSGMAGALAMRLTSL